jgi:Flp pilus assembly protein TadD
VGDKRQFRCVWLRVLACAAAIAAGALVGAAEQIGTLTPNPPPQASSLATAQQWVRDGRFAQAEALLRPLIAADPKAAEPRYLLAYALMREDKPADSLKEYTSAAALRTPTATELRNVALDYVLLKDLPDAERWMSRSLAMDSNDAETWYTMGRLHYTQGRYGDALTCFQKTLALNPRSVKGEDNLGLAYEALNRNDEAVRAYRTAIAWQKDDPAPSEQPLLNLAILLLHRNQVEEAEQLLEQAAKIAPKEPRIHENLGQVHLRTGRAADAVKQFAAAVTLAPENPRYHYLLGQAYRRQGDDGHAKQEFARSAALNGSHSTSEQQ